MVLRSALTTVAGATGQDLAIVPTTVPIGQLCELSDPKTELRSSLSMTALGDGEELAPARYSAISRGGAGIVGR
jgi:hypothetical protein